MRRVVFVKPYDKGSTRLGADQVAGFLRERGHDAHSIPAAELPRHPGAVAVFIKTSRLDHLVRARWAGTPCILDLQDTPCFKRRIKYASLFAGFIFRNARQERDFQRTGMRGARIPHHWDPRHSAHEAGWSELRAGFVGHPRSLPWPDLPGVRLALDESEWFRVGREVNCHVSVRRPNREWLYKPNTKVSTAAACGALLVTTADESALELLGTDYPYYCVPDRGSVMAVLERARVELGGPNWRLALDKLARVRELTHPAPITDLYVDYLASF